ncbi:MAG: hypothetical protein DRP14_02900, partial [Candidatus Aenigmatarchaeota archaeon]
EYPIITTGKYKLHPPKILAPELIIMVGCQGSGKSYYARKFAKKYNYNIVTTILSIESKKIRKLILY